MWEALFHHSKSAAVIGVLAASFAVTACGASETPASVEEEQPKTSVVSHSENTESAEAILLRGQRLYLRCVACHSKTAAEGHKVGPHLESIVGRQVGEIEGYNFSAALAESDQSWSEENLDLWIAQPRDLFTNTTMVFAGLKDPEDRAALIAYLSSL